MRKLFALFTIALALASCAEEEIPLVEETPLPNEYKIHIEITCDQPSTLYWQIQNENFALDDTTQLTFDTIVAGSNYLFAGFISDPPIIANYSAAIYIDDILVGDTSFMQMDTTMSYFIESIGPYYTE